MFWNKNKSITITSETKPLSTSMITENTSAVQPTDEWVEIIGYKGMDKNMRCRDGFQYKLGNTYMITDPSTVEVCKNGYHLCKSPEETFNYYNDFLRNRYFKVRAIVRKNDLDKYDNKIVAKEIEILEELTTESVYELICKSKYKTFNSLSLENFKRFRFMNDMDINKIMRLEGIQKLKDIGYSETFSMVLMERVKFISQSTITTFGWRVCNQSSFTVEHFEEIYTKAKAFKEEGLSPDMCAYLLLK